MLGLQLIWVVQIHEDAEAIPVASVHASVTRENRHQPLVVQDLFIPALHTPLQQAGGRHFKNSEQFDHCGINGINYKAGPISPFQNFTTIIFHILRRLNFLSSTGWISYGKRDTKKFERAAFPVLVTSEQRVLGLCSWATGAGFSQHAFHWRSISFSGPKNI
jgi:hypothetical protein